MGGAAQGGLRQRLASSKLASLLAPPTASSNMTTNGEVGANGEGPRRLGAKPSTSSATHLVMVSLPEGLMGPNAVATPLPQAIVEITEPVARQCLAEVAPLVARSNTSLALPILSPSLSSCMSSSTSHSSLMPAAAGSRMSCSRLGSLGEEPEYLTLSSTSHYSLEPSHTASQGIPDPAKTQDTV